MASGQTNRRRARTVGEESAVAKWPRRESRNREQGWFLERCGRWLYRLASGGVVPPQGGSVEDSHDGRWQGNRVASRGGAADCRAMDGNEDKSLRVEPMAGTVRGMGTLEVYSR